MLLEEVDNVKRPLSMDTLSIAVLYYDDRPRYKEAEKRLEGGVL